MKTTISILTFVLLFNFSTAGIEPRGVKLETPIKGLLLSGIQEGKKITNSVVVLAEDGTIYAADSATISADGKSIIFKGRPLKVSRGSRMFSNDAKAWIRVSNGDRIETSKSKWQMTMQKS